MNAALKMEQDEVLDLDECTYLIPEPNVERFRKKLTTLSKRAKNLGLKALASVDLGEVVKTNRYVGPGGVETVVHYRYRKVMVTGERPKLHGWTLLGTIAHEGGGNIFSNAPGKEIPEEYRNTPNVCDHCKTKRRRRDTMIIEKDGQVRQIGRNCLQDFVGNVNVKGVTSYYETWPSLDAFVGGMGRGVSRDYLPTVDYLSAVATSIRHDGFVSATAARASEGLSSTSSQAWAILFPNPRLKKHEMPPKIEDQDRGAALDILKWIHEDLGARDGLSGYLANLHAACGGGWLRYKHLGLAASAFRARENEIIGQKKAEERRQAAADRKKLWAEQRAQEKNEHFGEVKERKVWALKVLSIKELDSDWGGSYWSVTLKDPEGRMAYLTTTSGTEAEKLEKGKTYLIHATVKKHDSWTPRNDEETGDTLVTYLTRMKVKGVVTES